MHSAQWVLSSTDDEVVAAQVHALIARARTLHGFELAGGGLEKVGEDEHVVFVDYDPSIEAGDAARVQLSRIASLGASVVQVRAADAHSFVLLADLADAMLDAVPIPELAARAKDLRALELLGHALVGKSFEPDAYRALADALESETLRDEAASVSAEVGWRCMLRPLHAAHTQGAAREAIERAIEALDPPWTNETRVLAKDTKHAAAVKLLRSILDRADAPAGLAEATLSATQWGLHLDGRILLKVLDSKGTILVMSLPEMQPVAAELLGALSESASALEAAVTRGETGALFRWAYSLTRYSKDADAILTRALGDASLDVRKDAVAAITVSRWASALPELDALARSEKDPSLCNMLEDVLGRLR